MNCLCCGKLITDKAGEQERLNGWHTSCLRKFFGTGKLPEIDISEDNLQRIAAENTNKGYTVPGVQKKLSLHLSSGRDPRLTLVNYPTGYILKPQTDEYIALPEAEFLVMQMAAATGIKTVPFALLRINDSFAYITKRIDRVLPNRKEKNLKMFAMEDFCQLDGRLTQDKYRGSYERCGKIISEYSENPGLDLSEMFLRIIFSYAVGNSDMHLKNFSLIETSENSGKYVLSCAYDMLPVNAVMPEDSEQLALTLNGKKRNIRKNDFLIFAKSCCISEASAEKMLMAVASMKETYISMCEKSYLPADMKERLSMLIAERTERLILLSI